jgi:hypothetical protein
LLERLSNHQRVACLHLPEGQLGNRESEGDGLAIIESDLFTRSLTQTDKARNPRQLNELRI